MELILKVLVPIKRVIDHKSKIRVKADSSGVETDNVKLSINPFCEIALEEVLRLREKGIASEVVAVSIGNEKTQDVLRIALAMGANRAILVQTDEELYPLAIAKILKKVAEKEKPDMIVAGKQSIDGDNNQTGQMLAALLGWAQASFASKVEKPEGGKIKITCETDEGREIIEVKLPCVITADLNLNEPRYTSLPNIIKAKKMTLEVIKGEELGIDFNQKVKVLKISEPPKRSKGIKVASVEELVSRLKTEAKVL